MIETLILSITSFIGTNIDDMFIDVLFFSQAKSRDDIRSIFIGKYLGIGALVLVSIFGAFGLQFLPQNYIRYLGIIPIGLGIKEIINNLKHNEEETSNQKRKVTGMLFNVILVTIVNGADNIGVYIPLFAGFQAWQIVVMVCVFVILIAVWCWLGKIMAELPVLRKFMVKYKELIVPVVFIGLGIYILV